jgi:hypothetical protein
MAKSDIYDPDLILKIESEMKSITSDSMTSRHAMGGLYGCYVTNQATLDGI